MSGKDYIIMTIFDNPKIPKDLIYDYRGVKIKASRNEAGWNSAYVAGKIIEKIGPILAINNDLIANNAFKKIIKIKDPKLKDLKVKGLAINSKEVRKGYIFFAKDGIRTNGKKYINEALRLGANIVVYSGNLNSKINGLKYLKVKNINKTVVEACKNFYTSKPKNIFAVTGTNGKSSVVDLFCQILKHNKISVGSIGTLGIKNK